MTSQVDASTVSAGAFFSEHRLLVPDYQRRYRWAPDEQIADFWRDLSSAIGRSEYFLGLVILSQGKDRDEVVDGQQRLVTLALLANELRLIALRLGRRLVAESVRTDFLYSMDFATEKQVPRIHLTDEHDRADLADLLAAEEQAAVPSTPGSFIHAARERLAAYLNADIDSRAQPALRVGEWAEFLTKNVTFAVFTHPDRGAAFRVYEVINTRGKDLTPTELIKSHVIGTSPEHRRDDNYHRWTAIEAQLEAVNAADQLTTYVRHVVTLELGYVIPRELYQEVSSSWAGPEGVDRLLYQLDAFLPHYLQMIDPSSDIESSEVRSRSLALAEALSASRFRPILLAACASEAGDVYLPRILGVLVPGLITGRFASGSFEAQVARIARRAYKTSDWEGELSRLEELRPTREEFVLRLTRGLNKSQAHVIRSAYLQRDALPELRGYPHQVRPRNGEDWPAFGVDAYKSAGGLLGNWVLTSTERRPQRSHTPITVETRLVPELLPGEELDASELAEWSQGLVEAKSAEVAQEVAGLWYGSR